MSSASDMASDSVQASAASPGSPDDRGATKRKADQVVKKYMLVAMGVGLVPLPIIDTAALMGIQLALLSRLASLYKVEFSDQLVTSAIGSLLGAGGSTAARITSTHLLVKLIPGAGLVAGVVTGGLFGGASTYAVGKVFTQHFESGGTFLTFDPDKVRAYYAQQFERGTAEVVGSFAGVKP